MLSKGYGQFLRLIQLSCKEIGKVVQNKEFLINVCVCQKDCYIQEQSFKEMITKVGILRCICKLFNVVFIMNSTCWKVLLVRDQAIAAQC